MSEVIDIFSKRVESNVKKIREGSDEEVQETFAEIMKRNKENEERLQRERARANKSVTRSHRLKKK